MVEPPDNYGHTTCCLQNQATACHVATTDCRTPTPAARPCGSPRTWPWTVQVSTGASTGHMHSEETNSRPRTGHRGLLFWSGRRFVRGFVPPRRVQALSTGDLEFHEK